jgi:RNA polymerase sigma-70 factor (ECF subfamily)
MDEHQWIAERFEEYRPQLRSVAYRMLGSGSEAEDAVQEAWLRLSRSDTSGVENLGGWLKTIVARVCLDMLRSRKSRREEPLDADGHETLVSPEGGADPEHEALLADSVGLALLVVLKTLAPAERVAFVLHDVFAMPFGEIAEVVGRTPAACRQLATSARRRVHCAREGRVPRAVHDAAVRAFAVAARAGDLARLVAALDPDVVLRSDGGGLVRAARNPVRGADRVARFVLGVVRKNPTTDVFEQETPDGLGFALKIEGRVFGIVTLQVIANRITDVRMVLNPAKLTLWN